MKLSRYEFRFRPLSIGPSPIKLFCRSTIKRARGFAAPLLVGVLSGVLISGCDYLTANRVTPNPPTPVVEQPLIQDPEGFRWEHQVLEEVGVVKAEEIKSQALPHRTLLARQDATRRAERSLMAQIRQLPVNEDEQLTVGNALDQVPAARRAVEMALQSADRVEAIQLEDGGYQVRLRFALVSVTEILRQNSITPGGTIPEPPGTDDPGLGPLT